MGANVLLIAYELNGRAVALGRVKNPRLIRQAARAAVDEKKAEVTRLGRVDSGLGTVAIGELEAMEYSLSRLIPGMRRML